MSRSSKSRRRRHYILDFGSVEDIPKSKAYYQQLLKYHWDYYSEVAFQRAQIIDALRASLAENATAFEFSRWQRAVKYKYSLSPLSAKGSLVDPGGRFYIGEIDPTRFAVFPALYIASDKDTAMDELFARDKTGCLLSNEDLSLTRTGSTTIVSVSGKLESVLDLRDQKNLSGFIDLIKHFRLSDALVQEARRLHAQPPRLIDTKHELAEILMEPNWRFMPMQWDVPAPSQIFGQIAADAGIEGILYPSVLTKQPCLAVYPQAFGNAPSFIELDDPIPDPKVQNRIDAVTFRSFI